MTRSGVKVLVVDDTLLYRLLVKEAVEKLPGFKVVGTAENGKVALERVSALKPDLVLLDIEMPVMNGLEFLQALQQLAHQPTVLVVSSVTKKGGKIAMEALDRGAVDFLTKPEKDSVDASRAALMSQLQEKLLPLGLVRGATAGPTAIEHRIAPRDGVDSGSGEVSTDLKAAQAAAVRQRTEVIVIGVSTGGPQALATLLPGLPKSLPPIVIVQHMPGPFLSALAEKLNKQCEQQVLEAQHNMRLQREHIYIAPGGQQPAMMKRGTELVVELRDDPAENHCLPAVDYLFRTAAGINGKRTLGLLLTGMGSDGAKGMRQIRDTGGICIAQDEQSCTVFGMPKQAIRLGGAEYVLSLEAIREVLIALAH